MHDLRGSERNRRQAYIVREAVRDGRVDEGWLAEEPATRRTVILRRLTDSPRISPGLMEEFRKRFAELKTLVHPGIVPPLELLTVTKGIFVVLPYTGGITIRDLVAAYRKRGSGVSPSAFVVAGNQIIRALFAAHSRGIFHGNLTPKHLLIDERKDLRITDFQFPTPVPPDPVRLGKYAAPELRSGRRPAGRFSDIYAAAVLLYDMIAEPSASEPGKASLPDWFRAYAKFFTPALSPNPEKREYAFAGILEALKRIETEHLSRTDIETMEKLVWRIISSRRVRS